MDGSSVLVAFVWLLLAAAPRGDERATAIKATLDQMVGRDALVFASFPRPGALRAEMARIPVVKIAEEPEVRQLWNSIQKSGKLGPVFGAEANGHLERVAQLDRIFDRELSLALLVDVEGEPRDRYLVRLAASGETERVREFAAALERDLATQVFDLEPRRENVGDVEVASWSGSGHFAYALAGATLLCASDRGTLVRALGPAPTEPLGNEPVFTTARARVSAEKPLFFAYLNLRKLFEVEAEQASRAYELNRIAGLTSLQGIGLGLGFDGDELRDRVYLALPDGPQGIFRGLSVNPLRPENAKLAPEQSLAFFGIALKPREIYRTIAALARERGSPLFEVVGEPLDRFEHELGLEVGRDFVDLLGGEVCVSVALPAGAALIPDVVLSADLHDPAAFDRSVVELAHKLLVLELRETDFQGFTMRYAPSHGAMPLTLAWAIAGDTLVSSYFPLAVKGALARIKSGAVGLYGNAEFQQALARAGECQGLVYVNTARAFTYVYSLIVPMLQMASAHDELPFDPMMLPTAESIAQHLKFTVSAVRGSKDGIVVDTLSEGIGPAACAAYGAAALGLFAPSLIAEGVTRSRDVCSARLQALWIEAHADEKGNPREELSTAGELAFRRRDRARGAAADDHWLCPSDDRVPEDRAGYSSYEYFAEAHPDQASTITGRDALVFYDSAPRHHGGRNAMLGDGRVEWLVESEFAKRMQKQIDEGSRR